MFIPVVDVSFQVSDVSVFDLFSPVLPKQQKKVAAVKSETVDDNSLTEVAFLMRLG